MPSVVKVELPNLDLTDATLIGTDFSGANLIDAVLCGADLAGANLSSANLTGADLSAANLQNWIHNPEVGSSSPPLPFLFNNLSCTGGQPPGWPFPIITYLPFVRGSK